MKRRIPEDTRIALFEAGVRLIETLGMDAVTLASIGEGAGVTRQAVYLHFGSRAGYLLALVDHVNQQRGITDVSDRIASAASAHVALMLLIRLRAGTAPKMYPLISAVNAAVLTDPDAQAIWDKRQSMRYRPVRALAGRMRKEGLLRKGITVDDAASLMWAVLSFETWNYLVRTKEWSARKYERHVEQLIVRGLFADVA